MGVPYAEVIGDPVEHSKSPLIHKFWLEKLGLDYGFGRTRVRPEELEGFLETRRADPDWCGCSVTLPLKAAAVGLMAELAPSAAAIGAVNCILRRGRELSRLVGHNTDADGFLEPVRARMAEPDTSRIAEVIGAGGAAAAVCYSLDRHDFTVFSYARSGRRAAEMRQRLGMEHDFGLVADVADLNSPSSSPAPDDPSVLRLFVNATPLGMTGFPPLEVRLDRLPAQAIVYDLVYSPLETPLLRQALARGLAVIGGLDMLIGQAAIAFDLFFAQAAPREHDEELRGLLVR